MADFEAFCRSAHPKMVAAFTHHFGDRWLAEELAQESLIRAGTHWRRVATLAAPEGWVFRVGCNLGTSVMRRRGVEARAAMRRERVETTVHIDTDTPERLAVHAALESLPENQRRAVIARYFLGLSAIEAAEALGTSPGNIRVLTHRAIERLRATLGPLALEANNVA